MCVHPSVRTLRQYVDPRILRRRLSDEFGGMGLPFPGLRCVTASIRNVFWGPTNRHIVSESRWLSSSASSGKPRVLISAKLDPACAPTGTWCRTIARRLRQRDKLNLRLAAKDGVQPRMAITASNERTSHYLWQNRRTINDVALAGVNHKMGYRGTSWPRVKQCFR
jgi:hypothetical protein